MSIPSSSRRYNPALSHDSAILVFAAILVATDDPSRVFRDPEDRDVFSVLYNEHLPLGGRKKAMTVFKTAFRASSLNTEPQEVIVVTCRRLHIPGPELVCHHAVVVRKWAPACTCCFLGVLARMTGTTVEHVLSQVRARRLRPRPTARVERLPAAAVVMQDPADEATAEEATASMIDRWSPGRLQRAGFIGPDEGFVQA
ncbi:MAG: hypothetical protein HY369_01350 [Candidatus Aenigmarchaeota archaeon]|nr:hypothetical protein [Candidatus Aenigmarchaeota archaeon]